MEQEVERVNRYGGRLALLLYDIDKFKSYNDKYGHVEGDKVLVTVARTTQSCLRRMDTAYRYGGEEFTVMLPETAGREGVHVGERICSAIAAEEFMLEGGRVVHIAVSVGVTEYAQGEEISMFIKRADEAMYTAKREGGNRVCHLAFDTKSPPSGQPSGKTGDVKSPTTR
ncbi:GGDEF domain-containing protein [Thermodesulfobacteriota bacterium]